MAQYHLHAKYISRRKGRSSVAAAAYRAGACIIDERTGKAHDYTKKANVRPLPIITPDHSPAPTRAALWNKAEAAERRKDAKTAREIEISLPVELTDPAEQEKLALELAEEIATEQNCAVDPCLHLNPGNPHVHFLCTVRQWQGGELTTKIKDTLKQSDREKLGIETTAQDDFCVLRERVACIINKHLAAAGIEARVDHRSLEAQGRDDAPTIHLGPVAAALEKQGQATERGDINRERLEARRPRLGALLGTVKFKPKPRQKPTLDDLDNIEFEILTGQDMRPHY